GSNWTTSTSAATGERGFASSRTSCGWRCTSAAGTASPSAARKPKPRTTTTTSGRLRSPAALPPLLQLRPLRAERGVVAVPRVEPRLVGQHVEHPLLDVGHQLLEVLRTRRLADTAGEQRVTGEQVRVPLRVAVQQSDRTRRVATQVNDLELARADRDLVAVLEQEVRRDR